MNSINSFTLDGVAVQESISLSCSQNVAVSLSYALEQYQSNTFPSWVSLDSTTSVLDISTPTLGQSEQFVLTLKETTTENSFVNYRQIYIDVVYTPPPVIPSTPPTPSAPSESTTPSASTCEVDN